MEYDTNRFAINPQLTARELEITQFLSAGMSNQQIATRLVLSVRTVESHLLRMSRKLGVSTRRDIVAKVEQLSAD